jgi:hypothetical protein
VNRPGRQAGIKWLSEMSAEGATLCRRFNPILVYPIPHPGLTAGPIHFRPFGPPLTKNPVPAHRSLKTMRHWPGRRRSQACQSLDSLFSQDEQY